jgi:hypothetical protein
MGGWMALQAGEDSWIVEGPFAWHLDETDRSADREAARVRGR